MHTLPEQSQSQVRKRPDSRKRICIACLAPLLFSAMICLPGCGGRKPSITPRVENSPQSCVTAVVTSDKDSGPGSLREAINNANASPGADFIAFSLQGNRRINLQSPLPPIRDNVTINGFNQSGSRVELNGADAGANANGLTFIGSNNTMQGLVINCFKGHGVLISVRADTRADRNQISETVTITASSANKATNNRVVDNFIGTDAAGTKDLGNDKDGVFVDLDSTDCRIEGNLIAHNDGNGISLPVGRNSPVRIAISGNRIHSNGKIGIDLGNDGVTENNSHRNEPNGPNNWLNFPVLVAAKPVSSLKKGASFIPNVQNQITVQGTFSCDLSRPPCANTTFQLNFIFGTGCSSQSHQFVGFPPIPLGPPRPVTTNDMGQAPPFTFTFDFPQGFSNGFVNATATQPGGSISLTGSTSESSACLAVRVNEP